MYKSHREWRQRSPLVVFAWAGAAMTAVIVLMAVIPH